MMGEAFSMCLGGRGSRIGWGDDPKARIKDGYRRTSTVRIAEYLGTFYYLLGIGFWKTTESTEDTEKTATLCALRVLCG